MTFAGVWVIFRKELIDTLRDRKTLIFMLLIPTVAIPAMIIGIKQLGDSLQRKTAVETVRIAADANTHAAYRDLVHGWFLQSRVASALRASASPIVRALVKAEDLARVPDVPAEIFTDSAAFERWTRTLAGNMRAGLDDDLEAPEQANIDVPDAVRNELLEYYQVTIKGLALIEFVDPKTLPPAPADARGDALPAALQSVPDADRIAAAIRNKSINAYLSIPPELSEVRADNEGQATITLMHDSTIRLSKESYDRVSAVIDAAEDALVQRRLASRKLSGALLEPLQLAGGTDLASQNQIAMSYIGGILPYFVIAFAFMGGMYPAIDLGAGEKERNTLETLILSPSSRTEIACGKFLVIMTTALTAALAGLVSIALSIKYVAPQGLLGEFNLQLMPSTMVFVALLAVPPAAAFAGLFLAISIYARSFKEAQNYIAPLQFILILPALAPILPGAELTWRIALIPLVNVAMLSKEFLKGDTNWFYYAETLASCLLFAAVCLACAVRQFQREEVLFRS